MRTTLTVNEQDAIEVAAQLVIFEVFLRKPADTGGLLALLDELSGRTKQPAGT